MCTDLAAVRPQASRCRAGRRRPLHFLVPAFLTLVLPALVQAADSRTLLVPAPATGPVPAHGATVIAPLAELRWDVSPSGLSYQVYLGTDSAAVAIATSGSPEYRGSVTSNTIPPGIPLALQQTYFWRVDVVGFSGTGIGNVWRFQVAPLEIAPRSVVARSVVGGPALQIPLALTASGAAVDWSVSESLPWLTVDGNAGTTPDTLWLTLDPAGLTAGTLQGDLTFTASGASFAFTVSYELIQMSLSRMVTDYERPYLYALHPGSGTFNDAYLLFINTTTEQVEKIIPIGRNPTDMALSISEGKLYVNNWGQPVTRVVNLTTQAEVASLTLGTDVYKINAGRAGRVYTEGFDQWVALQTINSANGASLSNTLVREGDGATDPTGSFYYHCDNNISNAHITRYNISTDSPTAMQSSAEHPYGSRNLVMSGDGSRLFWRGYVYDAALTEKGYLGNEIYATSLHGELAFSASQVINSVNGNVLNPLPLTTTVLALSGDQQKLCLYDPFTHSLQFVATSTLAPVPSAGLNPVPADRSTVVLPLAQLGWDISPVGLSYKVYLGTDSAAVAVATSGSPEYRGSVTTNSIAPGIALALGQAYFWRVDVVGFSGTTPGTVWRFDVAPIQVAPRSVTARTVLGGPALQVPLALTASGASVDWSVSESLPWLTVDGASGTTPDTLWLTLDPAGLGAGTVQGSLTFSASDASFQVPVSYELFQMSLSQIVTDFERPYLYALHPGSGLFDDAFLLFINTSTEQVEKVIPIGKNPTDMAIHVGEGRLYVTNWGQPVTRVVNLTTQAEVASLSLGTDVYKINGGRPGRIYIEGEDQWVSLNTINSANGASLSNTLVREGDGATDPTGSFYYHCDNNISNAHITRYNISTDSPVQMQSSAEHPYGSRSLLISGDGSRLFWRGYVYDAALTEKGYLGNEIYATSLHGELAFSASQVINSVNGNVLNPLPLTTTVLALSGDQQKLCLYDPFTHSLQFVATSSLAPVPSAGLNPVPADRSTVVLPLAQLGWDISPVGLSYKVYLGTDSAAVAVATSGSPEYRGSVTTNSIAPGIVLALGQAYFWRVDVVGFSGTTPGTVWRFDVAPIQVAPRTVAARTVLGGPALQIPLALTASGASVDWSVIESLPWLTVDTNAGTTPDTLWLTLDPTGLGAGTVQGSLTFSASNASFQVPVSYELFQMSLSQIVTDFERPYLYALHPGSGLFDDAFLLFINTSTEQVEKVIPIGKNPTDMAIHVGEGRLYVTNWGQPVTRVVNLTTQAEVASLSLGTDVYKINGGRPGRIYIEGEDQWVSLNTINSANGGQLSSTLVREGDGATDPTGSFYYHCDNNISNAHITRYNISTDSPVQMQSSAEHPYGSRSLLISGDGSRLFWRGYVYDAALTEKGYLGNEIYATSLHGELAFSASQVINSVNGNVLNPLPLTTTVLALSGDQQKLCLYDPFTHSLQFVATSTLAPVPSAGLNPVPADRSTVVLPLAQLGWDISPVGLSYKVYLGTDSAAVAVATSGSPEYRGSVTTNSIAPGIALALGQAYFWRVDVVGFSGTTPGTVWRFDVAPIQVAPRTVTARTVLGGPALQVPLALTASGASVDWSVIESLPWLTVDTNTGTTPDTLWLTLDPAGLGAGTVQGSLTFAASDATFQVPVSYELFQMSLSQIVTDFERPYLYALHPGSGLFDDAFLLFINTSTEQVEKVIPIGKNPTDMAIHVGEGRLYVTNWGQPVTRVVNLDTRTELTPLALGTDVYKINAGRPGRIYTEELDQWIDCRIHNTANGAVVGSLFLREGDGAIDPTGNYYYHCDNNISNAHITRYNISTDSPTAMQSSAEHPYGSRNLVMSGDGTRLFWRGYVYNATLTEIGALGAEIYACTVHGDLAFTSYDVRNTATGEVVGTLPVATTVMALSADQTRLFLYDPATHSIVVRPMSLVPAQISLADAKAEVERVHLEWYSATLRGRFDIWRSTVAEVWSKVGEASTQGDGRIVFDDESPEAGSHSGYRLAPSGGVSGESFGETWVDVPARRFGLDRISPNPARGAAQIEFSLPSRAPAVLRVMDVSGRMRWERSIPSPVPGSMRVALEAGSLSPGIYFLRLEQSGRSQVRRIVLLQ